jgi:DNA-binding NarL/FixJ family response regulator
MKIILADDHALFRDALTHYIERSHPEARMILTRDFHGVMEAMALDSAVDLVMLDLRMPGMNGLQGLEKLKSTYPDVPVVLLSGVAERSDVQDAMALGASGYFPKTLSGKNMMQAIQKVLQGEKFLPMDYNTNAVMPSHFADARQGAGVVTNGATRTDINLTPREKEVLGYLLRGVSNKEIATALDLQVVTVKLHVRGVCRKLGAKNRTQAALLAQQYGLA